MLKTSNSYQINLMNPEEKMNKQEMKIRDYIRKNRRKKAFKAIPNHDCQNISDEIREVEDITPDSFFESKYLVVRNRDKVEGKSNIRLVICQKQQEKIVKIKEINLQESNNQLLHFSQLKDIFNLQIHGTENQIQMITMYTYGMMAIQQAQQNGIKKIIFDFLAAKGKGKEKDT